MNGLGNLHNVYKLTHCAQIIHDLTTTTTHPPISKFVLQPTGALYFSVSVFYPLNAWCDRHFLWNAVNIQGTRMQLF
jgi:hypothetical protein